DNFVSMEGLPTGMDVQGRFYYLTSYGASADHGFYILNVEDPGNIQHIPNLLIYQELLDVDVDGQLAYLADGTNGLAIVNVSNPYNLLNVGSVNTPGNASGVLVEGTLAYVADGSSGVHVVNVRNPSSPTILGTCDTPGNARRMALQGKTLYVADGSDGLAILDVADPANPILVDSYPLTYTWDVALYGGVVVVSTDDGVYTLQVGSMDSLSYVGAYSGGYEFWDVRVQGDIAYVAAGADGLLTIDVSDPVHPVLLDNWSLSAVFYRKIDVQGNFAYIADYNSAFRVFDVSDPSNIEELDYDVLTYTTDVAVSGDLAFVADGTYGVYVYNVSNPYQLQGIDFYDLGTENVTSVWVQGYHLYVGSEASNNEPFAIFDIRDPLNIDKIYSWTPYSAIFYDIYVDGDFAYTPDALGYFAPWNVTDPYNTYYTDVTGGLGVPLGVWGFGPYFVVANYSVGVALYDVSDVSDVQYIDCYAGATTAIQLTVHGDYVYVANRSSLVILRLFKSAAATYTTGTFTAQSINLQPSTFYYVDATLTVDHFVPGGTSANYFLSADGGVHWEAVTPGSAHTFAYIGLGIQWKVNFTSAYNDRSVHIYEVSLTWNTGPPAANPLPVIIAAIVVIVVIILILLLLYFFWYRKKEK
ncbi:MAG: LVIVD repeat-containing protein, partial [Promethearchaeota archaeon]